MMRSDVVFPQPEGPQQSEELIMANAHRDVIHSDNVAEHFAHVTQFNSKLGQFTIPPASTK